MTKADALNLARDYAAEFGVPWAGVRREWDWWRFAVTCYEFDIDTGRAGRAQAVVWNGRLYRFDFRPTDPGSFWLPPWAAFPTYSSATAGWRQSYGEVYIHAWVMWYRALPASDIVRYRSRFPEPNRDGWPGFYDGFPAPGLATPRG